MTRVREEIGTTQEVEITQDYSPGYDILLGIDKVLEGTRIRMNPNASTDSQNLVDIDINNEEVVDSLNDRYPLAWPAMYPGSSYSYKNDAGQSNARKLVKAVELWMYLNNFETTNLEFDELEDNLEARNLAPSNGNGMLYSDYLDSNNSPYRIPPETMWNREVFYNEAGQRIDFNGIPIPNIYIDDNGSPVFRNYDVGSQEELDVLKLSLEIAWYRNRLPNAVAGFVGSDGELIKPINDFTELELQIVRDASLLFSPIAHILPYSPFTLQGTRVIATRVAGTYAQKLYSTEYLAGTEYESTLKAPKTEYEWGGAYATGGKTY